MIDEQSKKNAVKMINRRKTLRVSQNEFHSASLKQSKGILNRPPGSI